MASDDLPGCSVDANASVMKWTATSTHKSNGLGTVADDNSSSPVLEDDLMLGAEARHLDEGRRKTSTPCYCKGKMIHMDSVSSDGSRYSIDQLLQDRRPDPEEMLRNLGFTAGSKMESRRRVPIRFLQNPSHAKGISLEELMKRNPELKECIEASRESMTPQGTSGHMKARSFKAITKTMRLINQFSHMRKTPPQDTSTPKNHIEPMQITSPDGYKYMTILDPENARYLDQQGHYKLSRQNHISEKPNIQSPTSVQQQKVPHEVDKTPLISTAVCNENDGESDRLGGEGKKREGGREKEADGKKDIALRRRLDLVESNKENVNLRLDINANQQQQPVVVRSPGQLAGCLIRPIARNHGTILDHFLQQSFSQKNRLTRGISLPHIECSQKVLQRRDTDCDVAKQRLDFSGASSELKVDEYPSTDQSNDYLPNDSISKGESDEGCLEGMSIKEDGSLSSIAVIDQGEDVSHGEHSSDTRRDIHGDCTEHSDKATLVKEEDGGSGNDRQLLYRRSKWHRCANFTIQVEPEESVAGESLNLVTTDTTEPEDKRKMPLLRDNSSQRPSMEEVESAEEDMVDESLPVFNRETSQGSLVRTGSGQSDSSGFVECDEESETTASFARLCSNDSVMESHAGSTDSSCTVCGSLDHDVRCSLDHDVRCSLDHDIQSPEHDEQRSVEFDSCALHSSSTSEAVAMTASDHHDNAISSSVLIDTEQCEGHIANTESNDAVSMNVPSWVSTSVEVLTASDNLLPLCSQSQPHVCDMSPVTSVTDTLSPPRHECQPKLVSKTTDTASTCVRFEVNGVDHLRLTSDSVTGPEASTVIRLLPGVGDGAGVHSAESVMELQHLAQSPQHPDEEASQAQSEHLAEEARQAEQQHLVYEVKQVQQAVVRYKSSLQMLESQSTEIVSTHISEQFRDELFELQTLRSDIFQEVVKLEHLLAVRMRLVIAGAGMQLQAGRTNHEHVVLPMIELLKEQTYHRSVIDTVMSQQSETQSTESCDTVVDTTIDNTIETPCQQNNNVPSYEMMFGQAMDELKVALLADIRRTIHSEMEPLRLQMQEFGDRLKTLEVAITNGQVGAPPAGTSYVNSDGVT